MLNVNPSVTALDGFMVILMSSGKNIQDENVDNLIPITKTANKYI